MSTASPRRRHEEGFTLLETIVTLVVVSLIVVVLMQALQQSLGLRTRLLRFERETRMSTLQEQWFRDSVSAALSDLPDALGAMQGDARSLALVSAAPLQGVGPERIRWTLRADGDRQALAYAVDRANPVTVVGGLRSASFSYLDADGRWQARWTPAPSARPLPRMVRFEAETDAGILLWLVPIGADARERRFLRPERMKDDDFIPI